MFKGHSEQNMMFPVKFDLQLFADEGTLADAPAQVAAPVTEDGSQAETSQVTASEEENPIIAELIRTGKYIKPTQDVINNPVEEVPPQAPVKAEEPPQMSEFEATMKKHGLIFKDPEAVANSYKNLQATFTHKTEEIKQLTEMQRAQQTQISEFIESVKASQTPPQAGNPEATTQEINDAIFNDPELLDKFYAKPAEIIGRVAEVIAQQKMQELVNPSLKRIEQLEAKNMELEAQQLEAKHEATVTKTLESFEQAHEDYGQYQDAMIAYLNGLPDGAMQGMDLGMVMDIAYKIVKFDDAGTKTPEPSLEEKLNDEAFVATLAQNEKLRDTVLKTHMATTKKTSDELPPVLGPNVGNGMAPAAQPQQFKTFKDGKKAVLSYFGVSPQ